VTVRVLALVPYPEGRAPGQRYRIEQWAPHLARLGVELTVSPFLSARGLDALYLPGHLGEKARATAGGCLRRLRQARTTVSYDVVYVYREAVPLGPAWLESYLTRGRPYVFDFDDALYVPAASPANAWARALRSRAKPAALCRGARHVTAGSEALAAFARPLARAVTVVPSSIDTDAYVPAPRPPNRRPVVGWTGSPTTVPHLEGLARALARARERCDYELRVIGGRAQVPGVDARLLPWRASSEVDDLRPVDVGLMPLPDDEWSRGKCGTKALQYMALGIPPVVSPVGAGAAIVRDGVNGYHARDEEEWVEKILRLLRDPVLRQRLGAEARRTVVERYSAHVQAPRMAAVLCAAAGRAPGPGSGAEAGGGRGVNPGTGGQRCAAWPAS
jgi:glycosyltransferase involved in cell wall biosynthesis